MLKTLTIVVSSLLLAACVPSLEGIRAAGDTICEHEFETRAALHLALERATLIPNEALRESALAAIRASLSALDFCPKV